ncbi:DNA (cytosine-5)-methyltransferase 1 [Kitasatospora sp. MAA19]|uniref:DNA cytosine methyltransferase n=1 Tax=Kitasatospora sp. MAA19 TaxID=3035090 RepID=UPI0024756406|nr:DNA cytosine methyltransferase [Kitasatospora sp. MAA19]MDH6705319.1 DNA (cytosine-5)-methyltransferase 1 [Kitasatospora sp. MAA19]
MQPTQIIDLFGGPGGLDVAAEHLGIRAVGIEWDRDTCATRRSAGLETVEGDVRSFGPSDFPDSDVLAAGPPCQTFTVQGAGAGRKALNDVLDFAERLAGRDDRDEIETDIRKLVDERTMLVLEPLRWALDAIDKVDRPYQAIVLEQVPAVLPVWEAYRTVLLGEGYQVACGILRAEEFGVPQTRSRAVLVARYGQSPVNLPPPTHRPYKNGVPRNAGDPALQPWKTMGEVLDRPSPFEVISNYGTGGDPRKRGRRSSEEPSATVTGKIARNMIYGPGGYPLDRFTLSEAGILQTFPANYPWSARGLGQQAGNAIPPRLAMHVLSAAFGWAPPSESELESLHEWRPSERTSSKAHDGVPAMEDGT